jgi:hypothetical protein
MRKLLILTVAISGFVVLFILAKHKNKQEYKEIFTEEPKTKKADLSIINKINEKNSNIDTILIKSMPVKVTNGSISFRLTGDLSHKKEKYFRFILTSKLTGREMDLGSNNQIFWFWSKRMEKQALYYSKHEDIAKTNLKAPLNPSWMIESLNVGIIDVSKVKSSSEDDTYIHLYEIRKNAFGEDCTFITTVNKKDENIYSRKMLDSVNRPIITTFYKGDIIYMDWKDENVSMEWNTKNKQTNVNLSESMWKIPDYKRKINMAEMSLVE